MTNHNIYINYPKFTNKSDRGSEVKFRSDLLKSLPDKHSAINFCKIYRKKLRQNETLYVYETINGKENGIYFLCLDKEGNM